MCVNVNECVMIMLCYALCVMRYATYTKYNEQMIKEHFFDLFEHIFFLFFSIKLQEY